MDNTLYPIGVIAVAALVTLALRAAPFLIFGGRPIPKAVRYLGQVLPLAIMTVLVIYCLRNTVFTAYPYGIPELAACALVAVLQYFCRNMYLSILAGTVVYMILLRVL
ncbi:MAG: AzlD domain-containing protein [Oscillospiraceae bacterium]|nr:AzlD domain-containing protein [Oscillospiraceae bacterium]